ncbi:hypothetical protein [Vibrio sp. TRT 17S01]|uniref:hypothetical protein n=1 Tax=Vibrio sp. TRT 17S01 TaxID=3418505 RepID=UPI003CF80D4E
MKLEFKLIWIDDQLRSVRGDVRTISSFFKNKEIELSILSIESKAGENVIENDSFIKALASGELDFILIDFNMPELNGSDVIEHIRKTLEDYHTPILFYTGDNPLGLAEAINRKNGEGSEFIDGIFYCHRDNISDKFLKIVKSQLKNDERINSVRGMLMEKVGHIDNGIIQAIKLHKDSVKSESKSGVCSKIKSRLQRKRRELNDALENVESWEYDEVITFLEDNPRLTDCHTRAESLREMLRKTENHTNKGDLLSKFYNCSGDDKCLNKIRNTYAHEASDLISPSHTEPNIKAI